MRRDRLLLLHGGTYAMHLQWVMSFEVRSTDRVVLRLYYVTYGPDHLYILRSEHFGYSAR